jgi:glutathione synthase/RimK-type ligase-like ATP-grasp enzyme
LNDLRARGLLVPESAFIKRGSETRLHAVLRQRSWEEAVVKPAISASALDTWRTTASDASQYESQFRQLTKRADVLVQRYVHEIAVEGEWSLVFIDGEFSHSVLKRPRAGDFRVQPHVGGIVHTVAAPRELRSAAETAVQHIPGPWLYARVDGIRARHGFLIMELECIEPHLFFGESVEARRRMSDALARR